MKKMLMVFCVLLFGMHMNAYGEYADPLKNPWVFTLEEHWPGVEPVTGNGMTFRLKVPIGDTDDTVFDLWQMDIPKETSTHLVLHPARIGEDDPSFNQPEAAIYKTAVVIRGKVEVYFSNCRYPYIANPRDTIHLMPGTPHKLKAMEDAVLMLYCYGEGAYRDKDKNFIKAYFDTAAADAFTVSPKDEELICNQNFKEDELLTPYDFPGPNNEIRRALRSGAIFGLRDPMSVFRNYYLKVAAFETNNRMEFLEYDWFSLDYYPHDHKVLVECMLITDKETTFWVGKGTANGEINVDGPHYGKEPPDNFDPEKDEHPASFARNGDGIRVKPGYVVYIPPEVPHSMDDTEEGNIWILTTNPLGRLEEMVGDRTIRIYRTQQ